MRGADRLVLVVNDECLSESALRGGRVWAYVLQISLHLSAEMADLQNVDYLSMCFHSLLASIVMGMLKILWFCFTFPPVK